MPPKYWQDQGQQTEYPSSKIADEHANIAEAVRIAEIVKINFSKLENATTPQEAEKYFGWINYGLNEISKLIKDSSQLKILKQITLSSIEFSEKKLFFLRNLLLCDLTSSYIKENNFEKAHQTSQALRKRIETSPTYLKKQIKFSRQLEYNLRNHMLAAKEGKSDPFSNLLEFDNKFLHTKAYKPKAKPTGIPLYDALQLKKQILLTQKKSPQSLPEFYSLQINSIKKEKKQIQKLASKIDGTQEYFSIYGKYMKKAEEMLALFKKGELYTDAAHSFLQTYLDAARISLFTNLDLILANEMKIYTENHAKPRLESHYDNQNPKLVYIGDALLKKKTFTPKFIHDFYDWKCKSLVQSILLLEEALDPGSQEGETVKNSDTYKRMSSHLAPLKANKRKANLFQIVGRIEELQAEQNYLFAKLEEKKAYDRLPSSEKFWHNVSTYAKLAPDITALALPYLLRRFPGGSFAGNIVSRGWFTFRALEYMQQTGSLSGGAVFLGALWLRPFSSLVAGRGAFATWFRPALQTAGTASAAKLAFDLGYGVVASSSNLIEMGFSHEELAALLQNSIFIAAGVHGAKTGIKAEELAAASRIIPQIIPQPEFVLGSFPFPGSIKFGRKATDAYSKKIESGAIFDKTESGRTGTGKNIAYDAKGSIRGASRTIYLGRRGFAKEIDGELKFQNLADDGVLIIHANNKTASRTNIAGKTAPLGKGDVLYYGKDGGRVRYEFDGTQFIKTNVFGGKIHLFGREGNPRASAIKMENGSFIFVDHSAFGTEVLHSNGGKTYLRQDLRQVVEVKEGDIFTIGGNTSERYIFTNRKFVSYAEWQRQQEASGQRQQYRQERSPGRKHRWEDSSEPDLYKLLEVSRDATMEQINGAYKKQSKNYHPDTKTPFDPVFRENRMKDLNISKEVLTDPVMRLDYDAWYTNHARNR
ncbi:MAG: DnaJ domain-containing protein [Candidatus Micrarchaeota archaeon]